MLCRYQEFAWLRWCCGCRAPEQADADFGSRGAHTDVWGFAACILHMASGDIPYKELSMMQMISAVYKKKSPSVPTSLPPWLRQLLMQCLDFDLAARPSTKDILQVR